MTTKDLLSLPCRSGEKRVQIAHFNGHHFLNLREFYEKEETGELFPTKKGVTFALTDLPALIEALREGERIARAEGLLRNGETENG